MLSMASNCVFSKPVPKRVHLRFIEPFLLAYTYPTNYVITSSSPKYPAIISRFLSVNPPRFGAWLHAHHGFVRYDTLKSHGLKPQFHNSLRIFEGHKVGYPPCGILDKRTAGTFPRTNGIIYIHICVCAFFWYNSLPH